MESNKPYIAVLITVCLYLGIAWTTNTRAESFMLFISLLAIVAGTMEYIEYLIHRYIK